MIKIWSHHNKIAVSAVVSLDSLVVAEVVKTYQMKRALKATGEDNQEHMEEEEQIMKAKVTSINLKKKALVEEEEVPMREALVEDQRDNQTVIEVLIEKINTAQVKEEETMVVQDNLDEVRDETY